MNPANGTVSNTRVTAEDALGIVIPLRSLNFANGGVRGGPSFLAGPQASWTWQFFDPTVLPMGGWRIRQGLMVTLHTAGNFYLRFAGGALYGQSVYASLVDGQPISGPADNAELTPWKVCSISAPGNLAIVQTSAFFTP